MKKQLTLTALLILSLATVHAQPQPTVSADGYAYSGSDDIDSVAWYGGSPAENPRKREQF